MKNIRIFALKDNEYDLVRNIKSDLLDEIFERYNKEIDEINKEKAIAQENELIAKDKLHRRNLQIKDLKEKYQKLYESYYKIAIHRNKLLVKLN